MNDYYPLLRAAIADAKVAGFETAATELESRVFAAYTTSSELMGEHLLAIRSFLETCGQDVPSHVKDKLEGCLRELRKG